MRYRLATIVLALSVALPGVTTAAEEPASFEALIDEVGRVMLARHPEEVTDLGLGDALGLDDRSLNDLSPEYRAGTAALAQDQLDRLATVERTTLTTDERVTLATAEWYLRDIVTMHEFADHDYAVNFITGAHANFPEFMADIHPLADLDDAEGFVARLQAGGEQLRQVSDNLRRSEAAGVLPTERGLAIADWQIANQVRQASGHPILADLADRLAATKLDEADAEAILDRAEVALADELLPAYTELQRAVGASATRSDREPGVLHHPDGAAYYETVLAHHLSMPLTPTEVHETGLAEVERVRDELEVAMAELGIDVERLGFAGAIEAVGSLVPAVPLTSSADREALLADTEAFVAEASEAFADMFTTSPASPIEVQRPRPGREGAGGAYYRPPPASGERPGIYYLALGGNTFPMDTYATTNYHEAVPGHHFQLALQRESEELPLLQRATGFTGYAEGWALYAERLAAEAGLYEDDSLGDIGRLRMELLRAARAVADTGIHAFDWSRDEAIAYLVGLGLPEGWAASEVDRYIVWPGQAPAYLIGMLEILRLRDEAQAALGDDFDLAGFHDAVLRHGSVPLAVLPMAVEAWVESFR